MSPLPTGTVTLLFSDMEGSTRLLLRLGDAYADALTLQRRVLRDAWQAHDGVELGTEGDSFYVAFGPARAARGRARGGGGKPLPRVRHRPRRLAGSRRRAAAAQ